MFMPNYQKQKPLILHLLSNNIHILSKKTINKTNYITKQDNKIKKYIAINKNHQIFAE